MSTEFSNHFYSNYFYTPHIYLIFGVNMRCHFQKDMWHFLQCVIINYMKSTGRNSGIHLWHYEHVFRDKKYFSKIKQWKNKLNSFYFHKLNNLCDKTEVYIRIWWKQTHVKSCVLKRVSEKKYHFFFPIRIT